MNYVKLEGSVGIIGNGAGLVMSTLDVVAYAGEKFGGVKPANFLDIGGGASAQVMADGLGIILSDPSVKSVFVNVFGGITADTEISIALALSTPVSGSILIIANFSGVFAATSSISIPPATLAMERNVLLVLSSKKET